MKATALMAALLITGCGTSGTSQAPVYVAGGVIGPGGGSVYLLGGPTLSIPPGALDFDLTVNLHWAADRSGLEAVSPVYRASPTGFPLLKPAEITFSIPSGESGKVTVYGSPSGEMDTFDDLGGVEDSGRMTAPVNTLGHFVLGRTCAAKVLPCDAVLPWCSGSPFLSSPTGACLTGRCLWSVTTCANGCANGACL